MSGKSQDADRRTANKIKVPNGDCTLLGKVFGWELVIGALFIPENTDYIPALAVVEKLKAVDAAREGLFTDGIAGFVGTEDVGFLAKLFGLARKFAFEKGVFFEIAACALDVAFGGEG
jgi:hypothetical protein